MIVASQCFHHQKIMETQTPFTLSRQRIQAFSIKPVVSKGPVMHMVQFGINLTPPKWRPRDEANKIK